MGLVRLETLRRTGLIGNYPASDMILLAELALNGCFAVVQEALFLRRDHAQTSVRANASNEDRAAWFDPKKRGGVQMPHWRWMNEYARAIRRARIGYRESARSFASLGKWARWNRDRLMGELVSRAGRGAG